MTEDLHPVAHRLLAEGVEGPTITRLREAMRRAEAADREASEWMGILAEAALDATADEIAAARAAADRAQAAYAEIEQLLSACEE